MKYKFEIFKDINGEYRFRLKSRNGKIIAISESYKRKSACIKTANKIIDVSHENSKVVDV